jgi:Flp pilus assembly protein TadD
MSGIIAQAAQAGHERGASAENMVLFARGYELAEVEKAAEPLFSTLFNAPEEIELRALLDRAHDADARALVILRRLLVLDPNNAALLIAQAQAAGQGGQPRSALAGLEKDKEGGADAELLRTSALLEQNAGRYEQALAILNRLQASAPKDPQLVIDRGVVLFLQGETNEAVRTFLAAIALDPRRADAYLDLGAAYEKQGNIREALRAYQNGADLKEVKEGMRDMLLKKRDELAAKSADTIERGK